MKTLLQLKAQGVDALAQDLMTAEHAANSLRAQCDRKDAEITELKAQVKTLKAQLGDPDRLHPETRDAVNRRAVELVASIGHPPAKIAPGAPSAQGQKSLLEQYNELVATDPEAAGKFYAEHANEIFTGQKNA